MNGLCHVLAISAAFCLLLALASGYSLQQPVNTNGLTEELMERRSGPPHFTVEDLLDYLNQRYEATPDKRNLRTTGLNAIDNVKGMYYNNNFNKMLAALKSHVRRR